MTEEAYIQIKKEIDGIISDCMHINVRIKRLRDRYGIQLCVKPEERIWYEDERGNCSHLEGGADFQIFRGGEELAHVLDSTPYVDRSFGDRRLKFRYRDCSFIQLATGSHIFRKAYRRRNRWTEAETVNNPVDEVSTDVL